MIFIVEDDANIREIEGYALKNSGFDVKCFELSTDLYQALEKELPQLILLDIMLPNEDGLSILTNLRKDKRTKSIPIMMVTAKTSEMDKVKGLDQGADDYITKPFGIMELVSRVKALLRRAGAVQLDSNLEFNGVVMNVEKHTVTVKDVRCELTYKEFELLRYLLENQGIVLSRDRIMERVWGFDYEGETRTVDMHIKTLRQKLGESGEIIKTVRNVGYKIGV
ncbi:MAG: response regulator transcription factor [Clostridiales bacterium]|nr:response regulator transcription factor [Clostridiales bacterium]